MESYTENRCKAFRQRDGERCMNKKKKGYEYCYVHIPKTLLIKKTKKDNYDDPMDICN